MINSIGRFMKIYIIGAGGMLGHQVYQHFTSKGHIVKATDIITNETWIEYQDIREYTSLFFEVRNFGPDIIINLAALTDLEYCETHQIDSINTNALGSARCATLASDIDATYVYISTAGIFDGGKDIYDDWDLPNPMGWYAKSKYWGELFATSTPKHIVLRCGWQMGGCEHDKKFVAKIMKQLKEGATELNVVDDKLGSPTYTVDFTNQIDIMINNQAYGIWNATCQGNASRHDIAVELINILNLQDKVKINKVPSIFWQKEYFAPRPASEKLLSKKLIDAGLYVMRPWQECLKEYVSNNPNYFRL